MKQKRFLTTSLPLEREIILTQEKIEKEWEFIVTCTDVGHYETKLQWSKNKTLFVDLVQ